MPTALTKQNEQRVARPLRVLVPLIQEDLKQGRLAAEQAGMPHWIAAGEKLHEAKSQLDHGEFMPWVERHFHLSHSTANRYMSLAEQNEITHARGISRQSQSEFIRETINPNYNKPAAWTDQVKQIVTKVDTETLNLAREELKRNDEREAQRELALRLIDIGFKVLAHKLHPDKGGSHEAMSRLKAVRDRLKQYA